MGRGDKRTEKGKRFKGSYGNSRPHEVAEKNTAPNADKAEKPVKKAVAKEPEKEVTAKKAPPRKSPAPAK